MQNSLFNDAIEVERLCRDTGIAKAADHANRERPEWTVKATEFFIHFVQQAVGPFMTEDVRRAAELNGLPLPPDRRAWGAVTSEVAKRKVIKRIGYGPQTTTGCHMAPKSIWRKA
jgi:hypothetical protein